MFGKKKNSEGENIEQVYELCFGSAGRLRGILHRHVEYYVEEKIQSLVAGIISDYIKSDDFLDRIVQKVNRVQVEKVQLLK